MRTKLIVSVMGIMTVLFFTNTSCVKHTDVKAKIICVDSTGRELPGANVKLFAIVQNEKKTKFVANVKAEGISDNEGKISFVFKLPAIFDVKATKGNLTGTAIIKVDEPGKEAQKTVILR